MRLVFQDVAMRREFLGRDFLDRTAPPAPPAPRSEKADDVAAVLASPFLVEAERAQRRLVARHEEDRGFAGGSVDMLAPASAGNSQRVETTPVEALAVDHAVAATPERRHQQARSLLQRLGALAGAQHLHEEG